MTDELFTYMGWTFEQVEDYTVAIDSDGGQVLVCNDGRSKGVHRKSGGHMMNRTLPWETWDYWVESLEQEYENHWPQCAYRYNINRISAGYRHGLIDMWEVKRLLEVNSSILMSKGIEPWEVLRNA